MATLSAAVAVVCLIYINLYSYCFHPSAGCFYGFYPLLSLVLRNAPAIDPTAVSDFGCSLGLLDLSHGSSSNYDAVTLLSGSTTSIFERKFLASLLMWSGGVN